MRGGCSLLSAARSYRLHWGSKAEEPASKRWCLLGAYLGPRLLHVKLQWGQGKWHLSGRENQKLFLFVLNLVSTQGSGVIHDTCVYVGVFHVHDGVHVFGGCVCRMDMHVCTWMNMCVVDVHTCMGTGMWGGECACLW